MEHVVSSVQLMAVREEQGMPPTEEEILVVVGSLKGGEAGGKNGVLPEMLKCCGANLLGMGIGGMAMFLKSGRMP